MRYVIVNEQSTRAELEAALVQLSEKVKRACIESTKRECREDQDECLELRARANE